jgi:TatD DNase family protein
MKAYQDAHNHLQHPALHSHLSEILATVRDLPVRRMVVNGTAEQDWETVAQMAKDLPFVIPSFGLHPWYLARRSKSWEQNLRQYLIQTKGAVGEAGLDLWMPDADLPLQKTILRVHFIVAAEFQRPITIHCLQAWSELLDLLSSVPIPACGFLLHSYSGPIHLVEKFAAFGSYFSFSGYFLNRGKEEKANTFRTVPWERLLVETDAPDMPLPRERNIFPLPTTRDFSSPNHPANIQAIVHGLADIRKTSEYELLRTINRNFRRLFKNVIPR